MRKDSKAMQMRGRDDLGEHERQVITGLCWG